MKKRQQPKRVQPKKKQDLDSRDSHPPPEDEYGGGDFASPEISPPTEDDKPLE